MKTYPYDVELAKKMLDEVAIPSKTTASVSSCVTALPLGENTLSFGANTLRRR
ncbi:hypothetical protein ACFQFQ_24875 [Sulfitobacter porphyrae]|uniref:Uncharacterized protein n=1 Tax=Sulfitobacter porphyrae TaxID=1246864 RepID=A0ABW2B8E8_9RHOB